MLFREVNLLDYKKIVPKQNNFLYMISFRDDEHDLNYIGKSETGLTRTWEEVHDLKNNCFHVKHMQNCFNKYGADNFFFKIIDYPLSSNIFEIETELIRIYDTYHNGFNQTEGGEGSLKHYALWYCPELIIDLYNKYESCYIVSKKTGYNRESIRNVLEANGIKRDVHRKRNDDFKKKVTLGKLSNSPLKKIGGMNTIKWCIINGLKQKEAEHHLNLSNNALRHRTIENHTGIKGISYTKLLKHFKEHNSFKGII